MAHLQLAFLTLFSAVLVGCHAHHGRGSGGATSAQSVSETVASSDASTVTTSGGGGGSTSSSSASTTDQSSSSGIMMTCNSDGTCSLPAGETCGVCADCVLGTPACGGCMDDGVCDQHDACTCVDCRTDKTVCPDFQCEPDGVCDYFTENCACADCAQDPKCA